MLFARPTMLLALFLLGCPLLARANERALLVPFDAVYAVTAQGFKVGSMRRTLRFDGEHRYRFTATFETTGLAAALKRVAVTESSSGVVEQGILRPVRYRYLRQSGKKVQASGVDFDWSQNLARGNNGDRRWQLPLTGAELDKLTYQLALAADLQAKVPTLKYVVPDGGKRQTFALTLTGAAQVSLDSGSVDTLRVEHRRKDQRQTTLWCDPARGFVPVQIEYREKDGSLIRARLTQLTR